MNYLNTLHLTPSFLTPLTHRSLLVTLNFSLLTPHCSFFTPLSPPSSLLTLLIPHFFHSSHSQLLTPLTPQSSLLSLLTPHSSNSSLLTAHSSLLSFLSFLTHHSSHSSLLSFLTFNFFTTNSLCHQNLTTKVIICVLNNFTVKKYLT